jgi:hypothetical protein
MMSFRGSTERIFTIGEPRGENDEGCRRVADIIEEQVMGAKKDPSVALLLEISRWHLIQLGNGLFMRDLVV